MEKDPVCGMMVDPQKAAGKKTVTDDSAHVPNHPGKSGEDLEHRAIVSR
ncbi:MAG: hypothetical protein ACJ746_30180 [Bryobacteraceae bacterium]